MSLKTAFFYSLNRDVSALARRIFAITSAVGALIALGLLVSTIAESMIFGYRGSPHEVCTIVTNGKLHFGVTGFIFCQNPEDGRKLRQWNLQGRRFIGFRPKGKVEVERCQLIVSLVFPVIAFSVAPILLAYKFIRARLRVAGGRCSQCGYIVSDTVRIVCPECGAQVVGSGPDSVQGVDPSAIRPIV